MLARRYQSHSQSQSRASFISRSVKLTKSLPITRQSGYKLLAMSVIVSLYLLLVFLISKPSATISTQSLLTESLATVSTNLHRPHLNSVNNPATFSADDKLIFVEILHRHGDRTVIHPLPKAVAENSTTWRSYPLPDGSLTSIGWHQHNIVGQTLKARYIKNTNSNNNILNEFYQPSSIYVRSTDVQRCVQSVVALLSAIYPPVLNASSALIPPDDESNINRKYQTDTVTPFPPLTIIPTEYDMLLQPTDKCPAYLLSYKHSFDKTDEIIKTKYPSLPQQLNNLIGSYSESISYDISLAADVLLCEEAHNLSYSPELSSMRPLMYNLSKLVSYHRFVSQSFVDARGSIGDILLRDLMKTLVLKLSNNPLRKQEKMRIYSSHDTTIVALLSSLHIIDSEYHKQLLPNYATVVTIELRQSVKTEKYYFSFRLGSPIEVEENDKKDWRFIDNFINIPCPNENINSREEMKNVEYVEACDIGSFARYVLIMTQSPETLAALPVLPSAATELLKILQSLSSTNIVNIPTDRYTSDDGCCVLPADFNSRCPASTPFNELHSYCKYFRRLCPASACGEKVDENNSGIKLLDLFSMNCVERGNSLISFSGKDSSSGLIITLIAILTLLLLLLILQCYRPCRSPVSVKIVK